MAQDTNDRPRPTQDEYDRSVVEWNPFVQMDALDDEAILTEMEGRTFKKLVYEFPMAGDDGRQTMVQGLSIKGVDAAAAAMARQGQAVREEGVDVVIEGDVAYFKARVSLYRLVPNSRTGQITEILTMTKLGVKRQPLRMKRRNGSLVDDPFWYEKGSSKAIRNAILRTIPEQAKQSIILRAAKEGAISRVPGPSGATQQGASGGARTNTGSRAANRPGGPSAAPWKPSAEKGEKVDSDQHPQWVTHQKLKDQGKALGVPLADQTVSIGMSLATLQSLDHALEIAIADKEAIITEQKAQESPQEARSGAEDGGDAQEGTEAQDGLPVAASDAQRDRLLDLADQKGVDQFLDPLVGENIYVALIDWEFVEVEEADRYIAILEGLGEPRPDQ